jgi:hypothetical protein
MVVIANTDVSPTSILVVVLCLVSVLYLSQRKTYRFPPGPPSLPVVGHTHLMSGVKYTWVTFYEWGKKYSDRGLMFLKLGTARTFVITNVKAAHDIFEKRSGIYSGT